MSKIRLTITKSTWFEKIGVESRTLPGLMGDKGLNGNTDSQQNEQYPQRVMPAVQQSLPLHKPTKTYTHTDTHKHTWE